MKPGLGFLGVGWIGRNRMGALAVSGVAALVEPPDESATEPTEVAQVLDRIYGR